MKEKTIEEDDVLEEFMGIDDLIEEITVHDKMHPFYRIDSMTDSFDFDWSTWKPLWNYRKIFKP